MTALLPHVDAAVPRNHLWMNLMSVTNQAYIDRALDTLDSWMVEQRNRVERNLQQSLWRVQATRNDGMTPSQIRSETIIDRRG
jgi:hypothetical protein